MWSLQYCLRVDTGELPSSLKQVSEVWLGLQPKDSSSLFLTDRKFALFEPTFRKMYLLTSLYHTKYIQNIPYIYLNETFMPFPRYFILLKLKYDCLDLYLTYFKGMIQSVNRCRVHSTDNLKNTVKVV